MEYNFVAAQDNNCSGYFSWKLKLQVRYHSEKTWGFYTQRVIENITSVKVKCHGSRYQCVRYILKMYFKFKKKGYEVSTCSQRIRKTQIIFKKWLKKPQWSEKVFFKD